LQISVRVTFDRGDVDAFVAEAIRLRDSGTSNYETIVAGAAEQLIAKFNSCFYASSFTATWLLLHVCCLVSSISCFAMHVQELHVNVNPGMAGTICILCR
jgi:hypothetical protein